MRCAHIAGTNGKGSVAEYLSAILTAAGQRCGCYTSPHILSPEERIRIGKEPIGSEELSALLGEVKEKGLAVNGSLFAQYTAAALLWFERRGADIAVIETGLGGRLDPTNVIIPEVTVLTPVDFDHTELLGSTLAQIAAEKCGIIKPGVPVISARQKPEARKVITDECARKGSPLTVADGAEGISRSLNGQTFIFEGVEYRVASIGAAQPDNAALAVLAAKRLGAGEESIKNGLKGAKLECRTQYLPGSPDILLDGAHNPASVDMLKETLFEYFPDEDKTLLFACMRDKDHRAMIKSLDGLFSGVFVTRAQTQRGEAPEKLAESFGGGCVVEEDAAAAFEKAMRRAKERNGLLVVCGSFYLAGKVLKILRDKAI